VIDLRFVKSYNGAVMETTQETKPIDPEGIRRELSEEKIF